MRNSCVQDAYEPGSTFKVLTTALALENGVTSVDDTFYCKGYTIVDGDKISCWRTGNPHGSETLVDAVANSCNPVFVELALRMGIDTFYDGLHDFGIGMEVPIDLPGATSGQMIAYKYVKDVDIARVAFGQSVSVSPVQLLTACSAAVNGGELLKPHIVQEILTDEGEVVESYGKEVLGTPISEQTSAIMRTRDLVYPSRRPQCLHPRIPRRRQDRHRAEVRQRQGLQRPARLLLPGLCAHGRPGDRPAVHRG